MSTARLLVLENKLGQKVRTLSVQSESMNIVYLKETRRVEAISDLSALDENEVEYQVLKKLDLKNLSEDGLSIGALGTIRLLADANGITSPTYELPEQQDDEKLKTILQKTSLGHLVAVLMLIAMSWMWASFFNKTTEPALVTIVVPKEEKPVVEEKKPAPHVQVSEHKIKPSNKTYHKNVTQKKLLTKPYKVKTVKATDVKRVGALAALGGLAKGHKGAEGLDMNSLKNIRSAGEGRGGGGLGTSGRGGVRGMMPGTGLIAGSAGEGARAQSAGGYGTKGTGGGRAGYGKISMVGGTSAVSLPLDDEATVEGGLDRDQIAAVINKNKGQIIYCYEKGLQAQPSIGGRVAVDFVIGPAGRITMAKVAQSSLGSRLVEGCMLDKMRSWQFPRPVGKVNVDVLYPFELMRVSSR
jgi:outer membrane biosynthesis protein TonB